MPRPPDIYKRRISRERLSKFTKQLSRYKKQYPESKTVWLYENDAKYYFPFNQIPDIILGVRIMIIAEDQVPPIFMIPPDDIA